MANAPHRYRTVEDILAAAATTLFAIRDEAHNLALAFAHPHPKSIQQIKDNPKSIQQIKDIVVLQL
jgi:hypothetical protein